LFFVLCLPRGYYLQFGVLFRMAAVVVVRTELSFVAVRRGRDRGKGGNEAKDEEEDILFVSRVDPALRVTRAPSLAFIAQRDPATARCIEAAEEEARKEGGKGEESAVLDVPGHGTVWFGRAIVGIFPLVEGSALILATTARKAATLWRPAVSFGSQDGSDSGSFLAPHDLLRMVNFVAVSIGHKTLRGALGVKDFGEAAAVESSGGGSSAIPLRGKERTTSKGNDVDSGSPSSSSSSEASSLAAAAKPRRDTGGEPGEAGTTAQPASDIRTTQGWRGAQLSANELLSQVRDDHAQLLEEFLRRANLHFSLTTDITTSSQRLWHKLGSGRRSSSSSSSSGSLDPINLQLADVRFFWNARLLAPLVAAGLHSLCTPCMDAFVSTFEAPVDITGARTSAGGAATLHLEYLLVSRRSCVRQGARYHTRGADGLGNSANFAEAEQIVTAVRTSESQTGELQPPAALALSAFIVIRGSIPTVWIQPNKGMKPKPVVSYGALSADSMSMHFSRLHMLYRGRCVCVSLIDKTGVESDLGAEFETLVRGLPFPADSGNVEHPMAQRDVRYVGFDFHAECKAGWHNLSKLLDRVRDNLHDCSFFAASSEMPSSEQRGVFRVNCIDCLDRTNVVKSLFARTILPLQIQHVAAAAFGSPSVVAHSRDEKSSEDGALCASLEFSFKGVWADNADAMSEAYTGTGALKADFTRTGKRSVKGIANDATNSIKRYYNQQHTDGTRQAAVDIFTGQVESRVLPPFEDGIVFRNVRHFHSHIEDTPDAPEDIDNSDDVPEAGQETDTVSKPDADGNVLLVLDLARRRLSEYAVLSGHHRGFGLAAVIAVSKFGSRVLSLQLATQTHPRLYEFEQPAMRERLYALLLDSARLPVRDISPRRSRSVCVATWDMQSVRRPPATDDVRCWLALALKHQDLVALVISVQNCDFAIVPESSDSIRTAWQFMRWVLQECVGREYVLVESTTASSDKGTKSKTKAAKGDAKGSSNAAGADHAPDSGTTTSKGGSRMFVFQRRTAILHDEVLSIRRHTNMVACSHRIGKSGEIQAKSAKHIGVEAVSIDLGSRVVRVVGASLEANINNEERALALHRLGAAHLPSSPEGDDADVLWVGRFNIPPVPERTLCHGAGMRFTGGCDSDSYAHWDPVRSARGCMFVRRLPNARAVEEAKSFDMQGGGGVGVLCLLTA
jgi:SacI homology domain